MQLVIGLRPFKFIRYFSGPYFGSSHDSFAFHLSNFNEFVENEIPNDYYVVGDSAYPQLLNLRRPHKGYNLTNDEVIFNKALSSQRMVIENTISELKNKFKKLIIRCLMGKKKWLLRLLYLQ